MLLKETFSYKTPNKNRFFSYKGTILENSAYTGFNSFPLASRQLFCFFSSFILYDSLDKMLKISAV